MDPPAASVAASTTVTEYIECDYEKDCTPLYRAIENAIVQEEEDYEHIGIFLETGVWPHDAAGEVHGPPADVQARTWVTRFSQSEKKVEWSQLPLHLAIVGGAPSNIIGGLVKLYPQGLRCTDDQQMLPLHLALRHGAEDEIVAYLLMQFPDGVNAKGKNGRSAVDCALRARDKLRGIVLETFVEKTKSKFQSLHAKEKSEMAAAIDQSLMNMDKMKMIHMQEKMEMASAIDETMSKFEKAKDEVSSLNNLQREHTIVSSDYASLLELKTKMEEEMTMQVQELTNEKAEVEAVAKQKIEKLTSEKLTESIELQKKIDTLAAEKAAAEEQVRQAKIEESAMRQELDKVQKSVLSNATMSNDDWISLKQEVDTLQAYRLTRTKSQTKDGIEQLKGEIARSMSDSKTETKTLKSEMKTLRKTVSKLEQNETAAKSPDDFTKLQTEVEALRAELRERSEATKTKANIEVLKKSLEAELKKPDGKQPEHLTEIERAIAMTSPPSLDMRSNVELSAIKNELEALSLKLKQSELSRMATADVEALERALDNAMLEGDAQAKQEYAAMKPAVSNLRLYIANTKCQDDLVAAAKDLEALKALLHTKQAQNKIKIEANLIRETVNTQLTMSAGAPHEKELAQLKAAIESLSNANLAEKNVDELDKIKAELGAVKKQLRDVGEASRTQNELDALKKTVEEELLRSKEKTEQDLSEMKKAVDAVNMEQLESKNLKKTLSSEIKKASGETEAELLMLKQKVDAINIKDLESMNKGEWDSIRKDMEILKVDLKHKQQAKLDDTDKELASVKAAIAQINAEQEIKTDNMFDELRKEMLAMRADLAPPPVSPAAQKKGKGGLMKLIASRFRRAPSKKSAEQKRVVEVVMPGDIPTIRPPSMQTVEQQYQEPSSPDGSLCSERALPPAVQKVQSKERDFLRAESKEMEVTLALHQSFSTLDDAEEQPKIDADSVNALPTFASPAGALQSPSRAKKGYLPSAMRKVHSMDPRMKSVTIDPYEIVRSWSKTTIQENGEVELEPVAEDDRSEVTTRRAN